MGCRSMVWDTEPRAMDQRDDVCARIDLAQRLEHFLAAAHPGQPVVHERDTRSAHPA